MINMPQTGHSVLVLDEILPMEFRITNRESNKDLLHKPEVYSCYNLILEIISFKKGGF